MDPSSARPRVRTPQRHRRQLRQVSFGGTAAVITSIGLVVGFVTASGSRTALVGSLLIVGLADNVTDSLSIHIYQESEGLESTRALHATVVNFATRLLVTATFVLLAIAVPRSWLAPSAILWGVLLLGTLTRSLARQRQQSAGRELVLHLSVAGVVVVLSWAIGLVINSAFH